ncbi:MAG TPA: hypothetical protein DEP85_04865 [Holosporales bacterium]|nr:hypothetical protein [Holosporales bacterium]
MSNHFNVATGFFQEGDRVLFDFLKVCKGTIEKVNGDRCFVVFDNGVRTIVDKQSLFKAEVR